MVGDWQEKDGTNVEASAEPRVTEVLSTACSPDYSPRTLFSAPLPVSSGLGLIINLLTQVLRPSENADGEFQVGAVSTSHTVSLTKYSPFTSPVPTWATDSRYSARQPHMSPPSI